MKRSTIIVIAIILSVIAGGVALAINNNADPETKTRESANNTTTPTANADQPGNELIIGSPDADVSIIEYADYKCSQCNEFHRTAGAEIRKTYVDSGEVNIVFRPYPVYGEDAAKALYASYCANDQGKFTEYHDIVFKYMYDTFFSVGNYSGVTDQVFTDDKLRSLITPLGIDEAEFFACIADKRHGETFDAVLFQSGDDEIQGTPSFIVDGQKIVGPQPFNIFKSLIDIHL